jgi:hypothetical protein
MNRINFSKSQQNSIPGELESSMDKPVIRGSGPEPLGSTPQRGISSPDITIFLRKISTETTYFSFRTIIKYSNHSQSHVTALYYCSEDSSKRFPTMHLKLQTARRLSQSQLYVHSLFASQIFVAHRKSMNLTGPLMGLVRMRYGSGSVANWARNGHGSRSMLPCTSKVPGIYYVSERNRCL